MAARSARTGPDDEQSPGPCCTPMPPSAETTGAAAGRDAGGPAGPMAAVIAAVLARTRGAYHADAHADAAYAAQVLLPAVLALDRLADRLARGATGRPGSTGNTGLAGLIHRRCRLAPASTDVPELAGAPGDGRAAEETAVALARVARGGWELIRGTVRITDAGPAWATGALVTHDLARRTAAPTTVDSGADPEPCLDGAGRLVLILTAADLREWARATGDHNPVHIRPGAARRAGLPAGEGDVVAHGLLLGGLSLALFPAAGAVDLRFTGAAPLRADGAIRLHAHADGGLSAGARTVLARR